MKKEKNANLLLVFYYTFLFTEMSPSYFWCNNNRKTKVFLFLFFKNNYLE